MVTHTNSGPLVLLALIILCLAIGLGVVINGTEIANPTKARQEAIITATQGALNAMQTQAVIAATETPRVMSGALEMTQTAMPLASTWTAQAVVEAATAVPMRQTATHAALVEQHEMAVYNATQAAIVRRAAAEQKEIQAAELYRWLEWVFWTVGGLLILVLIGMMIQMVRSNMQNRHLQTLERMYVEKRRLLELQAALRAQSAPVDGRHEKKARPEAKNGNRETFKVGRWG